MQRLPLHERRPGLKWLLPDTPAPGSVRVPCLALGIAGREVLMGPVLGPEGSARQMGAWLLGAGGCTRKATPPPPPTTKVWVLNGRACPAGACRGRWRSAAQRASSAGRWQGTTPQTQLRPSSARRLLRLRPRRPRARQLRPLRALRRRSASRQWLRCRWPGRAARAAAAGGLARSGSEPRQRQRQRVVAAPPAARRGLSRWL